MKITAIESTLEWHTRGVMGSVQDLADLIGVEDPRRIEHLWQMMHWQHFRNFHGVVRATAISAIEIALWDIAGKIANQPWGGAVRDCVRTYCHLGGCRIEDFYETPVDNAKHFGDLACAAVADGFTAFKSMAVPSRMPLERQCPIGAAEACVRAMR